ncbi:39S ribosomal protein L53, mitochondrial [Neodiprion lecontei]|uniref:Large ribosomal subunit protein mL53 n=1 Tax=Neodiprion lecontei TaxID=441921 RepID=A0A6J0CAG8_NEOLC|nr:39S ribosomal protein L53, mitochondrial [Neodiprion lecontei]
MSIPLSGTVKRSAGVYSALSKQLRGVNLKPVKKISISFDPFGNKTGPTRSLMYYLTGPKIANTNPNCRVKAQVLCDRSEPSVTFNLNSGENIIFKTSNLTVLELLQLFNKYISSQAPVEEPVVELKTKSEKKRR